MKNNTFQRLTSKELISLDSFLRNQTNDMTLVKAHGFITAIASFPELFMPSEWIPILVGEIKFLNDQTPVHIMLEKLVTIYKQTSANLQSNNIFQFILSTQDTNLSTTTAPYSIVQEWCNGYCLALVWNEDDWLHAKEDFITKACTTFFMLTDLINTTPDHNRSIEWQRDKQVLLKNLPDLVKALYTYWLGEQKSALSRELHIARHENCPCGSRKQFRNCCLQESCDAVLH